MSKDVIIACDFNSKADLMTFLDKFENEDRKPFLKVGMELFYAEGPAIVKEIRQEDIRSSWISSCMISPIP